MLFAKLFSIAALAATAVAQGGRIAFTSTPSAVEAGKPVTITWSGGNASPVTITLKKGDPNDLRTVAVLTGDASGNSFTWTPSSSLADGEDYALSISQGTGVESTNYSGLITLTGGSGTGSASASGTATLVSVDSSTTAAISTLSGVRSSSSVYITSTPILTGASSAGTGTTLSRNTTFSSPTLGSTSSAAASTVSGSATAARSAAPSATTGAAVGLQVQGALGAGAFAAALFFL